MFVRPLISGCLFACPIHGYKPMPSNFTSGWLGNGERAWHGQGVVTPGTLPAREAFETADALFSVEKRELVYPVNTESLGGFKDTGHFGIIRTDTQALLGVVSRQYEIVQNDSLLRMAEFIREEADMDCVIVLSGQHNQAHQRKASPPLGLKHCPLK